jgi:plasmid stabilization system protein ParE
VDYRLLFTQKALDDLAEIVGHIALDDDEAAARFGEARAVPPHGERHSKPVASA